MLRYKRCSNQKILARCYTRLKRFGYKSQRIFWFACHYSGPIYIYPGQLALQDGSSHLKLSEKWIEKTITTCILWRSLPPMAKNMEVRCKNSWKYSKSILSTILPNVRKINTTRKLLLTVGISKMPFFTFHPLKMNSTILAKLFSQKMITSVNINSKFNQGYNFYHNISNLYFQVITF